MKKFQSSDDFFGSSVYEIDEDEIQNHVRSMREVDLDYPDLAEHWDWLDGTEYATLIYVGGEYNGQVAFIEVNEFTLENDLVSNL